MPVTPEALQLQKWLYAGPAIVAFAAALLGLLNYGFTELIVMFAHKRWPVAHAVMVGDPADCPHKTIEYRYRVDERVYTATRVAPFQFFYRYHRAPLLELKNDYIPAAVYEIRHDPRRPGRAVIDRAQTPLLDVVLYLGALGGMFVMLSMAFAAQPFTFPYDEWAMRIEELTRQGIPARYIQEPTVAANPYVPFHWAAMAGMLYSLWRFGQALFFAVKSPKWPMATGRIYADDILWIAGPSVAGVATPERAIRDVRYTYRADEHRFESDHVTIFGNTRQSLLYGTTWQAEDPIELNGVLPIYHRPRKLKESTLVPGGQIARGGLMRLGIIAAWWIAVYAWLDFLVKMHFVTE